MGVSFVSIFIVSYHLVFWVCGAAYSLSWDYLPGVPQGEAAEQHLPWKQKPLGSVFSRFLFEEKSTAACSTKVKDVRDITFEEKQKDTDVESIAVDYSPGSQLARRVSHISVVSRHPSADSRPSATIAPSTQPVEESSINPPDTHKSCLFPPILSRIFQPLVAIVNPVTISLIISLPIALIQPLKALFVDVSNTGGPIWKAPDGRPPLAFMIDTGAYSLVVLFSTKCPSL